ncbi:unknown [Bacteroides sp. CAG:633]|nr:unknown [Bacteroides sp. CAG:633]
MLHVVGQLVETVTYEEVSGEESVVNRLAGCQQPEPHAVVIVDGPADGFVVIALFVVLPDGTLLAVDDVVRGEVGQQAFQQGCRDALVEGVVPVLAFQCLDDGVYLVVVGHFLDGVLQAAVRDVLVHAVEEGMEVMGAFVFGGSAPAQQFVEEGKEAVGVFFLLLLLLLFFFGDIPVFQHEAHQQQMFVTSYFLLVEGCPQFGQGYPFKGMCTAPVLVDGVSY